MITFFHHIGCLVHNIDDAIADYKILHPHGILSELYKIEDQLVNVQFFEINGTYIEFVQPLSEQSSLYKLLKKNAGFHHIGVFTDNIDMEIDRLEKEGYRKINKFRSSAFDNHYCCFLYNLEMHLIELIEK